MRAECQLHSREHNIRCPFSSQKYYATTLPNPYSTSMVSLVILLISCTTFTTALSTLPRNSGLLSASSTALPFLKVSKSSCMAASRLPIAVMTFLWNKRASSASLPFNCRRMDTKSARSAKQLRIMALRLASLPRPKTVC